MLVSKILGRSIRSPVKNETSLTDWTAFIQSMQTTYSGETVSPETAFNNLGIVFSCVVIRANALASLPLHVYKIKDGRKKLDTTHELAYLVETKPNHYQTPFMFKQFIQASRLLWGNAYVRKVYDNFGSLVELLPLEPNKTQLVQDLNTGKYFYNYTDFKGIMHTYNEFEVWHIPYITLDGKVGKSPLTVARENSGNMMSMQRFIGNFYKNGMLTQGALKTEESLGDIELQEIQKQWMEANSGGDNSGKIPILHSGLSWQDLSMPIKDVEFIATQKMNKAEIATIFNVPLFMLNDMEKATFNNFEQMNLVFSKNTLLPDCTIIEEEVKAKTFVGKERGKYIVEFDLSSAMRGDSIARADYYTKMMQAAGITPNEIRDQEGWNPSDDPNADKLFVTRNLALLEDIKANATGVKTEGGAPNEQKT